MCFYVVYALSYASDGRNHIYRGLSIESIYKWEDQIVFDVLQEIDRVHAFQKNKYQYILIQLIDDQNPILAKEAAKTLVKYQELEDMETETLSLLDKMAKKNKPEINCVLAEIYGKKNKKLALAYYLSAIKSKHLAISFQAARGIVELEPDHALEILNKLAQENSIAADIILLSQYAGTTFTEIVGISVSRPKTQILAQRIKDNHPNDPITHLIVDEILEITKASPREEARYKNRRGSHSFFEESEELDTIDNDSHSSLVPRKEI